MTPARRDIRRRSGGRGRKAELDLADFGREGGRGHVCGEDNTIGAMARTRQSTRERHRPRCRQRRGLSRKQKTEKRVHRMSNPFNVGDDGNALPTQKVLHADEKIFPDGAGFHTCDLRRDLIVQPHLFVPLQCSRHSGHQQIFDSPCGSRGPQRATATTFSGNPLNILIMVWQPSLKQPALEWLFRSDTL